MGWLDKKEEKKTEVPAEKTAENKEPTQDEMLAKLRTSFEEVIKPMREKIDSYETRFNSIEEQTRKPAPKVENTEIPSVLDDEDGAFRTRLNPLISTVSQISGQMVEDRVVADITAQGWGELVPDLRKTLATIHPNYKADPNYETSVRKIAFGMIGERAVSKGLKADPDKKTYFFAEDAGGQAATSSGPRISAEDARVMDKLGISQEKREEFLKQARPA
jgi:hypothetical protein